MTSKSFRYELSILIPARNEMFLRRTIEDILAAREAETEIIVILDGEWANPPVDFNERVTVVHHPVSIGQRAACNEAAKLASGKYLMKADAHCAFDKGFDRKMIEAFKRAGDNVTMVPTMRNLHAFDWVCAKGHRRYQSPSGACETCGGAVERDVVWIPKEKPQSRSFCFDSTPHFQYFNDWTKRPEWGGRLVESMSLQGSCFMLTKERYSFLGINDESFGSWGSQGIEVACKTWLSGGRVIVNRNTWYAHLFRTQGKDFGFPYQQDEEKIQAAKARARELFFENKWEKAVRPLSWLVEKFMPIKSGDKIFWSDEDLSKLKAAEIRGS